MSRHNLPIPLTPELNLALNAKMSSLRPETGWKPFFAWGLDNDGYFIQIWITDEDREDYYLEEGLLGQSNGRILDKIEKYGLTNHIRKFALEHYNCIVRDLPF
jgi:hypothetical protein